MIIKQGKSDFEPLKSIIESPNNPSKKENSPKLLIIIYIIISLIIFIFSYFTISNKNKIIKQLKQQLFQKELELRNNYKTIKRFESKRIEANEKKPLQTINSKKYSVNIDEQYLYDKNFYCNYHMFTNATLNKLGYQTIIHTHSIEKGLQHFKLRPFGKKWILLLISLITKQSKFENYKNKFSFVNGINSLREYKKAYEENGWTDKEEFKKVNSFLKNYTNVEKKNAGAYIISKKELEKDYKIDYLKFLKSRHSTRNYKNEIIKVDDVKLAVEMAKYTPSACNRQFIKLHFYPSGKMRDNVIKYAVGKYGIYLDGVNTFIVTFDVNGLTPEGERNLGYFNAGLYSTNLVNAFHSLGIGTCFIQFSNSVKEEEELKRLNSIPEYERIAVIIFAGYYEEKSIFASSQRKELKELLVIHD
jgi:nitroreductase